MAFWLDDGFDMWPEVVRAGSAAVGLYVRCGAWIARNIAGGTITDAVVPSEVAAMYGSGEWSRKLVDVGLWAIEGDAFRDLRYFTLNPTAEKVRALRDRRAEAGRKGGLASGNKRNATKGSSNVEANASANGRARATRTVQPPSLPPPSTKGEGGSGGSLNDTDPTTPPMTGAQARAVIRATTSAASRRRTPTHDLVDQELPLPWPADPPADPATATPPTAPTPPAAPPAAAPPAPANASADPTPTSTQTRRRRRSSGPAPTSPPAPDASPPSPATPTPAAGDRPGYPPGLEAHHAVWIATRRRGIEAHHPLDTATSCGRSTRTGHEIQASQAKHRHHATWCPRCWPTQETTP